MAFLLARLIFDAVAVVYGSRTLSLLLCTLGYSYITAGSVGVT